MLNAIRSHAQSFVVKALAGLLVISFGVWGINDMFSVFTSPTSVLFEVGDVEVERAEVENEVQREINRLRPMFGNQFGVDEAKALGLVEAVMQRQINDTSIMLASRELGVAISDNLVSSTIKNNPAFQGLGGFDRNKFQRLLYDNLLNENGFIEQTRKQMGRDQLIQSFGGNTPPKILVERVYRHRQEKRIVETVFIADKDQKVISEPGQAELVEFHKKNAAQFTAPEYRSLKVIRLEVSELAKDISVTDEELKEAYGVREDEFTTQATREVRQMILATEEEAKKAYKAITEGKEFSAVAKDIAKMDEETTNLGRLGRAGLPFPELADTVFSLIDGATSEPVKSPLGWHLFRASGIQKGGKKTLDEVKGELKNTVANEKALDSMFELANRLEDTLGGGATLEEAAGQQNLKVLKIEALDKSGLDKTGKQVASLPGGDFLDIAFSTDEGADSALTETGSDGYFILHVDGVVPPVLRPLDTVKDKVTDALKAEKRAEKSKKSAEEIVSRVNGGASFDVIAGEMRQSFKTSPAITRRPEKNDSGLSQSLITKIFAVNPGKSVLDRSVGGYTVARLKTIVAADPVRDDKGVKELSTQIGTALEADFLSQLAGAYRKRYGVNVNRQAVNTLFTTGSGRGQRPVSRR